MSALLAALRISRRDAWRARGRSALIMMMIGLPVLVITGLLTFSATADLTPQERLTADIGAADARLRTTPFRRMLRQDLQGRCCPSGDGPVSTRPWTPAELAKLLGPGTRLLPMNDGTADFRSPVMRGHVDAHELDLRDPLTAGTYHLVEGRFPASGQEVAVTPGMLEKGARLGAPLAVTREGRPLRVVGVIEHPHQTRSSEIVGLPGTLLFDKRDGSGSGWLADTVKPVTWTDVRRLNAVGLLVQSRAVVENPPSPAEVGQDEPPRGVDETVLIALAAIMIVLEVVLLAGPAFAVGLRRRRRELALIAAQGGSPGHLRMIVLADGIVLGGGAAVIGLALGVGLASLSAALEAGRLIGGVGPLEIPWGLVTTVALVGAGSGLVAALVPAVQAARQDVATVLGGRASAVRDRAGLPVLGLILLVTGIAAAVFAVRVAYVWVLAAALLAQLGLVALAPMLVRVAARAAARLPLPFRLAARDASRHRGRTACAVAAVMTAVAAVTAVGMANNSSFAERRDSFQETLPAGTTTIETGHLGDAEWASLRAAAERKLPGVPLIEGVQAGDGKGVAVHLMSQPARGEPYLQSYAYRQLPIGDEPLLALVQGRRDQVASAAFASGRAVVFQPGLVQDGRLRLSVIPRGEKSTAVHEITVPAVVAAAADPRYAIGVLPVAAVRAAGLKTEPRYLYIDPASRRLTPQQAMGLEWDLEAGIHSFSVYVREGFQEDNAPMMWLLLAAALVLVLGGTFAATGLAAADMRPDLTTMAAVGAPPGTRRLVVAGQAGFIAGLGVLIGTPAGLLTGTAALVPVTGFRELRVEAPWLFLAAVVIGLPLLAGLLAGTFARTRMTLARRTG
ncbi:ABC transporter permease [Streptosporangium sp. CA-135522]|uniref:ABC transporter permease n=1 Tax=Streptosporangium sp. CA-135522 TaxID=3240072 RepID=UPI003D8C116A